MKVRSLVVIRDMSVVATIGLGAAPGNVAAEAHHAGLVKERVGHGGVVYVNPAPGRP